MGHTVDEWRAKVLSLIRDSAGLDLSDPFVIDDVGIRPALAYYSAEFPHVSYVERQGAGSNYFDLPADWEEGFSRIVEVEFPARSIPPTILKTSGWAVVRSVSDVAVQQLWLSQAPTASQYVRFGYLAPWPFPTDTASVDKVDDLAYEAVTALAAARSCEHLASQAARQRDATLGTDFVGGTDRTGNLLSAAQQNRDVYDRLLSSRRFVVG